MKKFTYTVTDPLGLHARPAGLLVKAAKALDSAVTLGYEGKTVSGGRLIALMSLGVKSGGVVTVTVEGGDEEGNLRAMKQFFQNNV